MRVIAAPPSIADWQYNCQCGAVLGASEPDVRKQITVKFDQREGSYNVTQYYTECPLCKTRTLVAVPSGWAKLHEMEAT